jgi:hypothetical protein
VGLPARQEKVLESIESELQASDPKLAALYATFARLAADEELPRIEELRHRMGYLLARSLRFAAALFATLRFRRARGARSAVLAFPLALAVITTSITFAVRSSASPACASVRSVAAAGHQARTRLYAPTPAYYSGR